MANATAVEKELSNGPETRLEPQETLLENQGGSMSKGANPLRTFMYTFVRISPFVMFVVVVFRLLLGELLPNYGFLILSILGVMSVGAWFVFPPPRPHNGHSH